MPIRLRESRQLAHMSQEEAAEALGVSRRAVGNWENGTNCPNSKTIRKMVELYGVSADQLLGLKPLVAKD